VVSTPTKRWLATALLCMPAVYTCTRPCASCVHGPYTYVRPYIRPSTRPVHGRLHGRVHGCVDGLCPWPYIGAVCTGTRPCTRPLGYTAGVLDPYTYGRVHTAVYSAQYTAVYTVVYTAVYTGCVSLHGRVGAVYTCMYTTVCTAVYRLCTRSVPCTSPRIRPSANRVHGCHKAVYVP